MVVAVGNPERLLSFGQAGGFSRSGEDGLARRCLHFHVIAKDKGHFRRIEWIVPNYRPTWRIIHIPLHVDRSAGNRYVGCCRLVTGADGSFSPCDDLDIASGDFDRTAIRITSSSYAGTIVLLTSDQHRASADAGSTSALCRPVRNIPVEFIKIVISHEASFYIFDFQHFQPLSAAYWFQLPKPCRCCRQAK